MQVKASIASLFTKQGYSVMETYDVEDFGVDSAMDTDTDSWSITIGDPEKKLRNVLRRDAEVRMSIMAQGVGGIQALNTGFADQIGLDEESRLSFEGRDITSVAVDSQRPPGNFKLTRPHIFVERDARALNIGDRLRLTKVPHFKKFAVDGSESYWEVWYRLYRKRRMWIWAEPDGTLIAGSLNYNQLPTYFFGGYPTHYGRLQRMGWIPVERVEVRANKQQRVWEVYVIGNRGDISFLSKARDKTISKWIKRRQVFLQSSTAHNPAEARVEAYEELFEGKVGALEIKLVIADPGYIIRQNRVARVDISEVGIKGDFFVVGTRIVGNENEGLFQEVRLRERNYAISKRVPDDPQVEETPSETVQGGVGGVSDILTVRWKEHFVEAANRNHGPWPYKLFLAVLLAMCEQETGFRNVRAGGHIEYPGTPNNKIPSQVTDPASFAKFAATYANDPRFGRVYNTYAVGPMQLYSSSYKDHADNLSGIQNDELGGGRWMPRYNIIGGAFALRDKLKSSGAETALGKSGGSADQLIWMGVAGYGHHYSGEAAYDPRNRYAREVKKRYEDTYKDMVDEAVEIARQPKVETGVSFTIPGGSVAELRDRILSHSKISFGSAVNRDDIRFGMVDIKVMKFLLAFVDEGGFEAVVTSLKTGHRKYSRPGVISDHWYGKAVDIGNYNIARPTQARLAQQWILNYRVQLGYDQLIGPIDELVHPFGIYDSGTLRGHDNHLHIGF